ncbi:hypothetical protein BGX27_007793 [Mortierella sp. AM989]|nr:hypothetical protein BGX27_007793 [Mortierella sp. AM989]
MAYNTGISSSSSGTAGSSQYSIPTQLQKEKWAKQQSILKTSLVLADDHPDWSIVFKTGDTHHLESANGLKYIGGVDLSFIVVYENHAKVKLTLPYIAGYLAFREVDPLLGLIQTLRANRPELEPQVILVDGCGILHPRGFGLASHLGLISNIPTIGCSKNYLVIDGDGPIVGAPPTEMKYIFRDFIASNQDAHGLMLLKGEVTGKVYGAALSAATSKSADGTQNPIFVSIGHKVSLETAVAIVRACSLYRIPEPIRQADLKSRTEIKKWIKLQEQQ